jgi:hypothetical protein
MAAFVCDLQEKEFQMPNPSEKAIIDLETKFWEAIVANDTEAAIALMPDKSIVTGAQGLGVLAHDDYRRMAKEGEGRYVVKSFSFEDFKVIFPADNVAVSAYKVTAKMVVEDKPLTLTAADTTTWVKTDGHWLAAAHSESILGDPFGRDSAT